MFAASGSLDVKAVVGVEWTGDGRWSMWLLYLREVSRDHDESTSRVIVEVKAANERFSAKSASPAQGSMAQVHGDLSNRR